MMADYVKKRTHIISHVRFLDAGAVARDLYDWGMLWSGQQETDGEIPMTALLASAWGAGGKKNVVVANKLIEVGLWERTDTGYRVLKWTEQGNVTKALLVERRKAEREKKAEQRRLAALRLAGLQPPLLLPAHAPDCPPGTPSGTPQGIPAGVLNSTCIGSPISDLDLGRSEDPDSTPGAIPKDPPSRPHNDAPVAAVPTALVDLGDIAPPWWAAACETVAANVAPVTDRGARWLEYIATRERKGFAPGQRDAVGWLSQVVRREMRDAPKSSSRGSGGGPRGNRQGLDPMASWLPTGTDDRITGGDS